MNSTLENQQLEQVLTNALAALTRDDVQPWIDMFAEDGVQEFPYAPAGSMPRTEGGRQGVAAHLGRFPENFRLFRISPLKFHHSTDVTVAEFSVEGQAVKTGNAYNQQYVSVIEHRYGKITRYVDYWNPLTALLALGGPEAFTAFSGNPS
ncbi:nuclear transport factor 2 family protein [Hymenobacter coccineus]|uniref:SnoaL-like domain-containing protein n=1 Tax=Hymenobacter coccineus TaxID=1908235 RepID=A0A1G1TJ17_9BACT|nr:nuclear transport factor 2 family protein [Hymenobacter coccineus]OGX90869.1 hypothetical protein BEN49_05965 [Hymenobacter coccineus]